MVENILSKEAILAVQDLPVQSVDVPEWNGKVFIRGINAEERDDFEETLFIGEGKDRKMNLKNMRARLLSMTLCNEKGERLFTKDDIEKLGKKSARVLNKLFVEAQKLSALGEEDVKTAIKN